MTPNLDQERVERAAAVLDPWAFEGGSGTADNRADAIAMARAAITAYLGDTHVVVPIEPTVEMLAAAFPCEANEEFSHEDKVLGAAVCLKLGGDADIGLLEGEAVKQAAFLARDYRLMLSATPTVNGKGE